ERRAVEDAIQKKQWSSALAHLDRRLRANPSSWWDRLSRGLVLAELHRRREADAEFARAVARTPADPEVWAERGTIYAILGQLDRAAADFARAMEVGSGDAMVWYRCAEAGLGNSQTDAHLRLRAGLLGRVLEPK